MENPKRWETNMF